MKIDHIALYTPDLERMRVFYETYFNARSNELCHNPNTGLKIYLLSFPESNVRLEIMNRPSLEARTNRTLSEGYVHLAFSVGSR